MRLRNVSPDDLPTFFDYERDPEAIYMAAFTAEDPSDHAAFMKHWHRVLSDDSIINKTILLDDKVVGHIVKFEQFGKPEISYWIGKSFWGKGITTTALTRFLNLVTTRPLYARVVTDNIGSIRVLQKCGFIITGTDTGFANARGKVVEEYILELK